jgi:hypothetical protein
MGARTETKQEHRTLTLDDGTVFLVRTIRPDDASALQRFHGRLSERSIYLRFFGSMKELSDEKARYFAHTDNINHFALVALDPDEPDEIIAVTRYDHEAEAGQGSIVDVFFLADEPTRWFLVTFVRARGRAPEERSLMAIVVP